MIYLFAGDDTKAKLLNYERFLKTLPNPVQALYVTRNNLDLAQIESIYSGAGLFVDKFNVVFRGILDYENEREAILVKLADMVRAPSVFVFLEGKLAKSIVDSFERSGAEVNIFELPKAKKEKYDNFLVANAFGANDKLYTWIHFRRAIHLGVSLEEIVGVIFWKIKYMILKKDFRNFPEKKLKNFAMRLSYILPEARKQGRDPELELEKFLLEAI